MGFFPIFLVLVVGALCSPLPGTQEDQEAAARERLRLKTLEEIQEAANRTEGDQEGVRSLTGVITDALASKHTWKFLFDQAFTSLHAEGTKFTEAATEVFEKTSARLGYIYHKSTSFVDALKQYLSRSVGFSSPPNGALEASNAGRDLYIQALANLRGHVFQGLTSRLIKEAVSNLGANHTSLGTGIVLLGLSTSALAAWLLISWSVGKYQERKQGRKEKKARQRSEAGSRLIRDFQEQQWSQSVGPSAAFNALGVRGNQGAAGRYELTTMQQP